MQRDPALRRDLEDILAYRSNCIVFRADALLLDRAMFSVALLRRLVACRTGRARGGGGSTNGATWAEAERQRESTERRAHDATLSDLDLGADLDDAFGREAEERGGGVGVAREVRKELLAP